MSRKLTTSAAREGLPEPLTVLLGAASQSVLRTLASRLRARGYDSITEAHLILFGNLDCGATHAAQIAQRMQVSRQAISKTLRELEASGFLRLEDDPDRRNQKLVIMTEYGSQFAVEARDDLRGIEAEITYRIGADAMAALRGALEEGWGTRSGAIERSQREAEGAEPGRPSERTRRHR
jgi:DNA-binding MarR family transcriptional regulator